MWHVDDPVRICWLWVAVIAPHTDTQVWHPSPRTRAMLRDLVQRGPCFLPISLRNPSHVQPSLSQVAQCWTWFPWKINSCITKMKLFCSWLPWTSVFWEDWLKSEVKMLLTPQLISTAIWKPHQRYKKTHLQIKMLFGHSSLWENSIKLNSDRSRRMLEVLNICLKYWICCYVLFFSIYCRIFVHIKIIYMNTLTLYFLFHFVSRIWNRKHKCPLQYVQHPPKDFVSEIRKRSVFFIS